MIVTPEIKLNKNLIINAIPLIFIISTLQYYNLFQSIYPVDAYFHFKRGLEIKNDGLTGVFMQTYTKSLIPNPYPPLLHIIIALLLSLIGLKLTNAVIMFASLTVYYLTVYLFASKFYGKITGLIAFAIGVYFIDRYDFLTLVVPSTISIALSTLSIIYLKENITREFTILSTISCYFHMLGFYYYTALMIINYKKALKNKKLLLTLALFSPWIAWMAINSSLASATTGTLPDLNNRAIMLLSLAIPSLLLKDKTKNYLWWIIALTITLLLITGWHYYDRLIFTFSPIIFALSAKVITELLNIKKIKMEYVGIIALIILTAYIPSNPYKTLFNQFRILHEISAGYVNDGLVYATQNMAHYASTITNETEYIHATSPYAEMINLLAGRKTCSDSFLSFWNAEVECNERVSFLTSDNRINSSEYRILRVFGNLGAYVERI